MRAGLGAGEGLGGGLDHLEHVEGKLGGALEECVGGYDLIYNGGAVKSDKQSCYSNKLGCFEDRVRQLKKLHKAHAKRIQAAAQAAAALAKLQ